jgi:hypothetical protein
VRSALLAAVLLLAAPLWLPLLAYWSAQVDAVN